MRRFTAVNEGLIAWIKKCWEEKYVVEILVDGKKDKHSLVEYATCIVILRGN